MTTSLANSFVSVTNAPLKPAAHQSHVVKIISPSNNNLSFSPIRPCIKRRLTVQARADSGGASSSSIFVGGFILGGFVVGALGCVYAPKITEALAGVDKKEVMKKLPKFIYDEEKALEKTRKTLEEKIAQLNLAIDEASGQYQSGDGSY